MRAFKLTPDPRLPLADESGSKVTIIPIHFVGIDYATEQAIAEAIFEQGREHEREQFRETRFVWLLAGGVGGAVVGFMIGAWF